MYERRGDYYYFLLLMVVWSGGRTMKCYTKSSKVQDIIHSFRSPRAFVVLLLMEFVVSHDNITLNLSCKFSLETNE